LFISRDRSIDYRIEGNKDKSRKADNRGLSHARTNSCTVERIRGQRGRATPCMRAEKTGGFSSDVREMGNGGYEQKAIYAINQVLRRPERSQSARASARIRWASRLIAARHC